MYSPLLNSRNLSTNFVLVFLNLVLSSGTASNESYLATGGNLYDAAGSAGPSDNNNTMKGGP